MLYIWQPTKFCFNFFGISLELYYHVQKSDDNAETLDCHIAGQRYTPNNMSARSFKFSPTLENELQLLEYKMLDTSQPALILVANPRQNSTISLFKQIREQFLNPLNQIQFVYVSSGYSSRTIGYALKDVAPEYLSSFVLIAGDDHGASAFASRLRAFLVENSHVYGLVNPQDQPQCLAFYFRNGKSLPCLVPSVGAFFDRVNAEQSSQRPPRLRLKYSSDKISQLTYQQTARFRVGTKWRKVVQQSVRLDVDESFEMVPSPIRQSHSFELPPPNPPLGAHLANNSDVFSCSKLVDTHNNTKTNTQNPANSQSTVFRSAGIPDSPLARWSFVQSMRDDNFERANMFNQKQNNGGLTLQALLGIAKQYEYNVALAQQLFVRFQCK